MASFSWVGTGWKASSRGEIWVWVLEMAALVDKPLTGRVGPGWNRKPPDPSCVSHGLFKPL